MPAILPSQWVLLGSFGAAHRAMVQSCLGSLFSRWHFALSRLCGGRFRERSRFPRSSWRRLAAGLPPRRFTLCSNGKKRSSCVLANSAAWLALASFLPFLSLSFTHCASISGSVGKVGVSRPSEALPKAARADGNSGWPRVRPFAGIAESNRPCYAASTFSASSMLAIIIFLAASASSEAGFSAAASGARRSS